MKKTAPPVKKASDLWIYALLAAGIFACYGAVLGFGFVNYDDPVYIANNPNVRDGVTWSGVVWAFSHSFAGNWFPLTWISHMLDCQFFGLSAGAHHFTNLALHTAATLLLFAFLRRVTEDRWPSAFVAALFALHPLHVESVAWIAERKDVLSAFFWMLTLWCYARYVAKPSMASYAWTLAAFACALMAKPMAITLPLILTLLDSWPFARGWKIPEKLPFLALSTAVAVVTYTAHAAANAVVSFAKIPLAMRVENALAQYAVYIGKMFWPGGLAVFYPYPKGSLAMPAALAGLALAAVTVAALRDRGKRPYVTVGWLWYLVTLVPVIGLVQAGEQARADRYMYFPMVGLSIMLAWGGRDVLRGRPRVAAALAVSACAACAAVTLVQVGYWENGVKLFQRAVDVTPGNYVARFNLAHDLRETGDVSGAIRQLEEAVRIEPDSGVAHDELGQLLGRQGRYVEALLQLRQAEIYLPDNAAVHHRIGVLLANGGQHEQAVDELEQAARLDPSNADIRGSLAVSLAATERIPEAVMEFHNAVTLKPNDATLRYRLGIALMELGKKGEAISQFEEALRLNGDFSEARAALDAARK